MPAVQVSNEPVQIRPYDVSFVEGHESGLLIHAMLFVGSGSDQVTKSTELDHFHMGPPLGAYRSTVYAIGTVELSPDQTRQIRTFVDSRRSEKEAEDERRKLLGLLASNDHQQYWLMPDAVPPSPDFTMWRFSCVGFVRQSYRAAGIELLSDPLPELSVKELSRIYPAQDLVRVLASPTLRARLVGLHGNGPWPVSLVGYLMHSLSRATSEIHGPQGKPYVPVAEDSHFPHSVSVAEQ